MPVKYEQLKSDQRCIYQAFQNLAGNADTPQSMGTYVNERGIDADDDAAVQELARRYGLTDIEMFLGESWNKGTYNLNADAEYVLTVNQQNGIVRDFQSKVGDRIALKGDSLVREIQKKYPHEVGHAIYCKTKKDRPDIDAWLDMQKIYQRPPQFPDEALVVACGRKRSN